MTMAAPPPPRLSVGLPVFNGERYLEACVRSILDQTYADFELVIADNASSDATEDICRALSRVDGRVRYLRHGENIGAGPNHNFVLEQATGELFRWAAADDLISPTAFARCVERLDDAGTSAVLAFSQTEIIDEHGEHVGYWAGQGSVDQQTPDERLRALIGQPSGHLYSGGPMSPFYGIVRTAALRSTRLHQSFYGSDRVLLVELVLRGKLVEVPEALYERRQHSAQSGGSWSRSGTALQRDKWVDPSFRGIAMPQSRLVAGYIKAVLGARMTSAERRRCLRTIAAVSLRNGTLRDALGEVRRAPAALAARLTEGSDTGRHPHGDSL
jgi:glycosyltransferase involved in cell wall biosynthesis